MGGLILGVNTLYRLFKLFTMVGKGLMQCLMLILNKVIVCDINNFLHRLLVTPFHQGLIMCQHYINANRPKSLETLFFLLLCFCQAQNFLALIATATDLSSVVIGPSTTSLRSEVCTICSVLWGTVMALWKSSLEPQKIVFSFVLFCFCLFVFYDILCIGYTIAVG